MTLYRGGDSGLQVGGTVVVDDEIIAAVKRKDGVGSGLDADRVHGTLPTAYGLSLLDDANAAEARTTLNMDRVFEGWGSETSATYVSATSFKVSGDQSSTFKKDRRVQAVGSTTGTITGTITGASVATDTTVTVTWDSGNLANESLTVWVGILTAGEGSALPVGAHVAVSQFGAPGDGSDQTTALNNAARIAAALKVGLWFDYGSAGRYVWSPTSTVDLTGIPWIDGAGVTVDLSAATVAIRMKAEGSRALVASGVAISKGGSISATVATADLDAGDVLVIASNETLANTARAYYRKGHRCVVHSNDGAGNIEVRPSIPYAFTSAYLYRIDQTKIRLGSGITFDGDATEAAAIGFQARYAHADVAAGFRNWPQSGFEYITSEGTFNGSVKNAPAVSSSGGYGVAVYDFSEVNISARIHAARHAISLGGADGTWETGDVGATAGTNLAFPSRYTVSGGHYTSDNLRAIDAHGCGDIVTIGDCIASGIQTGARVTNIGNVALEGIGTNADGAPLYWTDNNSIDWGEVNISNLTIKLNGTVSAEYAGFDVRSPMKSLIVDGLDVSGDWASATSVRSPIYLAARIGTCHFSRVKARRGASSSSGEAIYIAAYTDGDYRFEDVDIGTYRFRARAMENGCRIELGRPRSASSWESALLFEADTAVATDGWERITVTDPRIELAQQHGINAVRALRMYVDGGYCRYNAQSAAASLRAINANETLMLAVKNCDLGSDGKQQFPLRQTVHPSTGSTMIDHGNDYRGNATTSPSTGAGVTRLAPDANGNYV